MSTRLANRAQALDRICDHLLASGLASTSLRQLASAAGVSDRMLLYYFKDKDEILSSALERLVMEMTSKLEVAVPASAQQGPEALFRQAAKVTRSPELRPYMLLWIEVSAAAARGQEPYSSLARFTLDGFHGWVLARLAPQSRKDAAAAALLLAAIDGLALLDAGSDTLGDLATAGGFLLKF